MEEPVKNPHGSSYITRSGPGARKQIQLLLLAGINGPEGLKISKLFLHYQNDETKVT